MVKTFSSYFFLRDHFLYFFFHFFHEFTIQLSHMETKIGVPNDWLMVSVGNAIMSGIGYICIDSVSIEPNGRTRHTNHGIWDLEQTEKFISIVNLAKQTNTIISIQLTHAGRKASNNQVKLPYHCKGNVLSIKEKDKKTIEKIISSSHIPYSPVHEKPLALSKKDISEIIKMYVEAAKRAVTAGFDVIEIQAGKYLLSGVHPFQLHFLGFINLRNCNLKVVDI